MAKIRTIYFQEDVDLLLKNAGNVSGLINDLVRRHFHERKSTDEVLQEKQDAVQKLTEEVAVEQERAGLERETIVSFPKEILEDFKFYPAMDEKILLARFTEIYKKKYGISWDTLVNAWKLFKK